MNRNSPARPGDAVRPAGLNRRRVTQALGAGAASLALPALAQAPGAPVRVGYAIARTGPWSGGAQISQEPNYVLWAEQQNAAGGLDVGGKRRPVRLEGFDDRSELDTCIRIYERLMGSDKVDLILPPWGTPANLSLAPLANRFRYPLLAPTAMSRRLVDMNLPYFFSLLQQADRLMGALVDMLVAQGVKTIAFIYMDDLFGLENFAALNAALKKTNIRVLERKSYALGVQDLSPVLSAMKELNPDAFVGMTYPPDTLLASRQAKQLGFNPKVFYVSVGTAFQLYRDVMGASAEGVVGMGTWNSKSSAAAKTYFDAHTKRFGTEPDRWASGHCWAALQILTQAVGQAGLDRKAIRDLLAKTSFQTVIGTVRFAGTENVSTPGGVGQWQNGEFELVWPRSIATASLMAPKPAWR
jgi:branched-chain amino acid transport system substrate-binding protein